MNRLRSGCVLAALLALAACEGGGTTGPGQTPTVTLGRVENLVPGATAKLVGTGLTRITGFSLDGQGVVLDAGSDTERTFVVPVLRGCETDGRAVALRAAEHERTTTLTATIRVPGTVAMEPGEARVLRPDELTCIRLPAANQDFALVLTRPEIVNHIAAAQKEELLTFRTGPSAQPSPARASSLAAALSEAALRAHVAAEAAVLPEGGRRAQLSSIFPPFDPRYATAQVGDTVRFINAQALKARGSNAPPITRDSVFRDPLLSYPAVVAAVAGRTVFAVDLRVASADAYLTEAGRAYLRRATEMVEPLVIPVMREVFDPAYEEEGGEASRRFAVINESNVPDGASAIGGDGVSDVPATFYHPRSFPATGSSRALASVVIHEFAHGASSRTMGREPRGTQGTGFLTEPWAVVAQEVAMRMASNQPTGARPDLVGANAPYDLIYSMGLWGRPQGRGAFSDTYSLGAVLLMYSREAVGHAGLTPETVTLFRRLTRRGYDWRSNPSLMAALAAEVGTTPEALLDAALLAAATDDLVTTAAASARGLPFLSSWDHSSPGSAMPPLAALKRSQETQVNLAAAPSGYAAAYLMAEGELGLSLEVTSRSATPYTARLIRLR